MKKINSVQVREWHYDFNKYVNRARFNSYYTQLSLIYSFNPSSILEIWVWNSIVWNILSKDYLYETLDIDVNLNPTYVWNISDWINLNDNKFDTVCAFQVLEHLPFNDFEKALMEMSRLAEKNIVISLPYKRVDFRIWIKLPLFKYKKFNLSFPMFWKKHLFDWEHYWEIWSKEYSLSKIHSILNKYWDIEESFNLYENTYHYFFVLKLRK